MEEGGNNTSSMESRPAMTTEISDAARELVQRLFDYFIDYRYGSSGTPVLWHVEASEKAAQLALTDARNSGVKQMREMIIEHINNDYSEELATGLEQEIRAMKVTP